MDFPQYGGGEFARLTFTLVAYNVAQIAKSKVAERLKARGIQNYARN